MSPGPRYRAADRLARRQPCTEHRDRPVADLHLRQCRCHIAVRQAACHAAHPANRAAAAVLPRVCPLHPLVTALSAQADGRGHRFEPDDLGQIAAAATGGDIPAPPCSRLDHFGDCKRGDPVCCGHPRVRPHMDGHHRDRHPLFLHYASRAGRRGQAQGAVVLRGCTRSSHHHDRSPARSTWRWATR